MKKMGKLVGYLQIFALAVICISHISSMAMSRIGSAVITEENGLPCFSIQSDKETRDGLPLDGIVVSETRLGSSNDLPEEVWHFMVADPLKKTILRPSECVRYGETPQNSVQRTFKQLKIFRVYSVSVIARNENTNLIAYSGKFCIKPDRLGKIGVQAISNSEVAGNIRYDVCTRPK